MMARRKIDENEPTWSDLWCRRTALGLTLTRLAAAVGIASQNLAAAENGRRPVSPRVWPVIERCETAAAVITRAALTAATTRAARAVITLDTYRTDDDLTAAHPDYADLPVEVHRVAIARAAATLTARGYRPRIRILMGDNT